MPGCENCDNDQQGFVQLQVHQIEINLGPLVDLHVGQRGVPHKFFLRRPTRAMTDEAELYYGVKLAEGIKAGLLTRALLEKRFENDGGTRSDQENSQYKKIVDKLQAFHEEQSKILKVDEKKRTPTQKKKLKELEGEIQPARRELRDLQLMVISS